MLDAWSLTLDACMTLLPLMVLKEPHNCIDLLEARIRCTLRRRTRFRVANDLIRYSTREFFNAHRNKHLKLIYPNKLDNQRTCCPA